MKEKKNKYPRIRVKMQSEEFSDLLGKKEADFHQEHHHKDTFITKYIFSQDHKMIAKQYLITGVLFMGFIGIAMSLLFRLQLAWPEQSCAVFDIFF